MVRGWLARRITPLIAFIVMFGALALVSSAQVRPAPHFCRVYGTKNTITVDYLARTVLLEGTSHLPSAIGRLVPAFERAARFAGEGARNVARFARADFQFFAGLMHLIRAYYRCILDDGPPPIANRDMIRIAAMMEETFTQIGAKAAPRGSA